MNVVVVGASGVVGVAVHKELADHGHRLRCVDLEPPRHAISALLELFGYEPSPPEAEWVYRDILGPGVVEAALQDMDACVYVPLALPKPEAPLPQYAVNLAAARRLADAAARKSRCKLVYASTVSVNPGQEGRPPVSELDPPRLGDDYGMSKWLAEEMLRQYSQQLGLGCICLRLGTIHPHLRVPGDRYVQYFVDVRDVARAFRLAVEDTKIKFDVLHVVSQGEPCRASPARAREILGFETRYNGPAHFAELRRRSLAFRDKHQAPERCSA